MATTHSKAPAHASNVYLFKNGYGMIVKLFEFPVTEEKTYQSLELIDPPSNAVHGTFWIQPKSTDVHINSIRTKKTRQMVEKDCLTVEDLLTANVGANVQLQIADHQSKSHEWIPGQIKSVKRFESSSDDEDNVETPVMPLHLAGHRSFPTSISARSPTVQQGNLILFETTSDGLQALPLSSVQSVRGASLKTTYERKKFANCLSINYKNTSETNQTGLMKYLTFGLTWVPTYDVVLLSSGSSKEKRLRLSSKAVILNDIENMHVDHLFCIVGFPNISKFASITDPIVSGDNVQEFLQKLNQCENSSGGSGFGQQSVMSNSIMTQQMAMPMAPPHLGIPDLPQSDTDADDLHLYEFKDVLLQKKERLMLPIFDLELPYKDIYHCRIGASPISYGYAGHVEKKDYEEVWHSVEFENRSNFVWTTAPVVVTKGVDEQQFIGQDKITYTLKGSTVVVNLTKTLDVRVQFEEAVINTEPKRLTISRVNYQTDHIEGKLTLTNYKSEEVVVVLNTSLSGKLNSFSNQPKKDLIKPNTDAVNQQHDVQWEVTVKPRGTVEIRYVRFCNRRV